MQNQIIDNQKRHKHDNRNPSGTLKQAFCAKCYPKDLSSDDQGFQSFLEFAGHRLSVKDYSGQTQQKFTELKQLLKNKEPSQQTVNQLTGELFNSLVYKKSLELPYLKVTAALPTIIHITDGFTVGIEVGTTIQKILDHYNDAGVSTTGEQSTGEEQSSRPKSPTQEFWDQQYQDEEEEYQDTTEYPSSGSRQRNRTTSPSGTGQRRQASPLIRYNSQMSNTQTIFPSTSSTSRRRSGGNGDGNGDGNGSNPPSQNNSRNNSPNRNN